MNKPSHILTNMDETIANDATTDTLYKDDSINFIVSSLNLNNW